MDKEFTIGKGIYCTNYYNIDPELTGKVFYHADHNKIILMWFNSEAAFKRLKNRFIDCVYIGNF